MSKLAIANVTTAGEGEPPGGPRSPAVAPALTIIAHPDPQRAGERCLLGALLAGKHVALSRNAPEFAKPGSTLARPIDDPFVSRRPIHFVLGQDGRVVMRVDSDRAQVVVGEPIRGESHFGQEDLARGVPIEIAARVVVLLHLVSLDAYDAGDPLGMVGASAGIQRVRQYIGRIVDLDVPVLIRGETGTGKELVARAIHERSRRRGRPFVCVNLGAIPKDLAAAELFGVQRGAYTGATRDREGFFRAAHGGTLFLDEVGEASPEVQVMLLRVLDTGEIYPVGGQCPIAADVRLIAATDADLEEHIRTGRFKAPLLHRLAGYEIRLPPLRERREDIGLLFYHFAREELAAIGEASQLEPRDPYAEPWLPAPLAARLLRHVWPGNIRQLRNVTRQLVIGSRGLAQLRIDPQLAQELDAAAIPHLGLAPTAIAAMSKSASRRKASQVDEQELLAALRDCAWDLKAAADRLGIPRPSIYDLIERNPRIRTAGDLSAEEITRCFHECGGDVDAMVQRLEVSRRALQRRIKELGLAEGRQG